MRILTDTLYDILDNRTGEWVTFVKTTTSYNGTVIDSSNESIYIDGVIYIKLLPEFGGGYAKRVILDGCINVRWFPIVGDGVTDDFLPFQTALRISSLYQIPLSIPPDTNISLGNKTLVVYENANIIFKGGILSNGVLTGNSTIIQAGIFQIFSTTLSLSGTFNIEFVCPQHFGAKTNANSVTYENDISEALEACIASKLPIKFPQGFYYLASPITIPHSQTLELVGISEIISGNADILVGHTRIYTDQNIHLFTIQSGGVKFTGGVIDVLGVTAFTKSCIRFDLNYEIWDGYFDTYMVGDGTQLSITEGLEGYGYYFDMENITSSGNVTHVNIGGYIKFLPTGVYIPPIPDTAFTTFINSNVYNVKMYGCKQFYNVQDSGGVSTYNGLLQCADVLTVAEKLDEIYPFELHSSLNEVNTFLWDINLRDQSPEISYKLKGYTFCGPFTLFHYNTFSNQENVQAGKAVDNPPVSTLSKDKYGYSGTFISKLDSDMAVFDKRNTVTMKAYKGAGIDFDTDLDPMVIAETTDITLTNQGNLFRNLGLPPTVTFTTDADLDVDFVEIVLTPSSGTFQWSAVFLYLYQVNNFFKRLQLIEHYSGVPTEVGNLYPTLDGTNAKKLFKWLINGTQTSDLTIIRLIGNHVAESEIKLLDLAGRSLTPSYAPYISTDEDDQVKYGNLTTTGYKLLDLNTAPASAGAAGTKGDIRVTATHIYVCSATNTWVRTALSSW